MPPFAEKYRQIGNAVWLLFLYADLAINGGKIRDSECARLFGVPKATIIQWRDRLIRAGLAAVHPCAGGGIYVELRVGSDLQSLLDALSANGVWMAANRETGWPNPQSTLVQ